jgi:hypothetical protein
MVSPKLGSGLGDIKFSRCSFLNRHGVELSGQAATLAHSRISAEVPGETDISLTRQLSSKMRRSRMILQGELILQSAVDKPDQLH